MPIKGVEGSAVSPSSRMSIFLFSYLPFISESEKWYFRYLSVSGSNASTSMPFKMPQRSALLAFKIPSMP